MGTQEFSVLIDSGSTHNFVSEKVAQMLHLPVIPTRPFIVKVADGNRLQCQGRFEKVRVILQGIPFSLTLYSLPLTGLDFVLGIEWLEMLGSVVCNWKKMTMEFQWENQTCRLQGVDDQPIQATSLKMVSKEVRQGGSLFAVCVNTLQGTVAAQLPSDMQQILQEYEDIFKEPTQLPPSREVDHQINLKEGTEPVNVRPYRYAYF